MSDDNFSNLKLAFAGNNGYCDYFCNLVLVIPLIIAIFQDFLLQSICWRDW